MIASQPCFPMIKLCRLLIGYDTIVFFGFPAGCDREKPRIPRLPLSCTRIGIDNREFSAAQASGASPPVSLKSRHIIIVYQPAAFAPIQRFLLGAARLGKVSPVRLINSGRNSGGFSRTVGGLRVWMSDSSDS